MIIRQESPRDFPAIHAVVTNAFGRDQEANLVDNLRSDGDLAVSLVAEKAENLCGHIALSRMKSPGGALALAPVAVITGEQKRNVGSALVREALRQAQPLGASIVFVVGEPGYYSRFGFSAEVAKQFPSPFSGPYFMAAWLSEARIKPGPVAYADAFAKLD